MAAETALWDDSALITAFNEAMSKYKEMHKGSYLADKSEEDEVSTAVEDKEHLVADQPIRDTNANGLHEGTLITRKLELTSDTIETLPPEESQPKLDAPPQDSNSGTLVVEEGVANDPSQLIDYNQLLNQYYIIEEQRQKILEQLNQAGADNTLGNSYVACNPSHYPYDANQNSTQNCFTTCPSLCCACHMCVCSGATCSVPPCNLGDHCLPRDSSITPPHPWVNVLRTAMEATGKVFSQPIISANISNDGEESKKENSHVIPGGELLQNVSMGMDKGLSDVLNAWYTAGFYTAKYLHEKSAEGAGK